MFHERSGGHLLPPEPHFRWRGGEITRLEGFSDAVFAFAVTLLVVSLEVPHTFDELIIAMKGFVPFGICFAILVQVWFHHYIFSRRYGLQTRYAVVLNAALLFVVLLYVYPLKFLFTEVFGSIAPGKTLPREQIARMLTSQHQVPVLMVIYSIGATAVFVLFMLLYRYAYQNRRELELNEYETLATRHSMIQHMGYAAVGLLVAIVAVLVPERYAGLTGLLFCLNGVWGWIAGATLGRRERLVLARMQTTAHAKID
jgi:uncharacterized membrane protein